MDKNFINIDDLVRQRLGGGEEQERSGAWLRMSDLLDKEMPQEKRIGFLYWRRMLSAVAVLLLIATISVGGYELSATRGNSNASTNTTANLTNSAIVSTSPKPTTTPANNSEINNDQITTQGIAENGTTDNKPEHKKLLAANTKQNKQEPSHTSAIVKNAGAHDIADQKSVPAGTNNKDNDPIAVAGKRVASNETTPQNSTKIERPKAGVSSSAPVTRKTNTTALKTNETAGKTTVAPDSKPAPVTKTVAEKGKTHQSSESKIAKITIANKTRNKTSQLPESKAVVATKIVAAKSADHKVNRPAIKGQKMEAMALGSHATSTGTPKAGTTGKLAKLATVTKTPVATAKTSQPLSSHATASTKKVMTAAKIGTPTTINITKGAKAIADKNAATESATAKGEPISSATLPLAGAVSTKGIKPAVAENAALKQAYALNTQKGKKYIQKLVIFEHYISTDPIDGHFNLDTISMETLNEELGIAKENNPLPGAEHNPNVAERTTANPAPGNNSNGAGTETAASSSSANPQILPGAIASANGKPAMGQKASSAGKSSGGSSALENLNSAFNDIKYKVNAVQFAPGLTAGINGTFFGPNSFKGFEFGVTGDFIFGNDWSFTTELKYFHRINNNFSLADNYYAYTPVTGGYNKELQQDLYSFSTLHSLEMPLIIKYTAGKFNLFVGGNLVYTFSINTGRAPQPSTGNITYTPAMGSDNTPKLSESDFNSRFGFGCLFGVSYKIAPNVTLDIRNVMTLWDNANSTGAKYVSDQLYKSPSLQLSLGYRLGGNKKQ